MILFSQVKNRLDISIVKVTRLLIREYLYFYIKKFWQGKDIRIYQLLFINLQKLLILNILNLNIQTFIYFIFLQIFEKCLFIYWLRLNITLYSYFLWLLVYNIIKITKQLPFIKIKSNETFRYIYVWLSSR